MFINCPKCGFNQPQDRYCAQCGIDMEKFEQNRPKRSRLFGGSTFYIILAIVFSLSTVYYLYSKKDSVNQKNYLSQRESKKVSTQIIETKKDQPHTQNFALKKEIVNEIAIPSPENPQPSEAPKPDTDIEISSMPLNIQILEIPLDILNNALKGAGANTLNSVVSNFSEKLTEAIKKNRQERMTTLYETKIPELKKEGIDIRIKTGPNDKFPNEIGIEMIVNPISMTKKMVDLKIEVEAVFLENAQSATQIVLGSNHESSTFSLHPGQSYLSAGFIPHRAPRTDYEKNIYSENQVLKIFNSPLFSTEPPLSELVIVFKSLVAEPN